MRIKREPSCRGKDNILIFFNLYFLSILIIIEYPRFNDHVFSDLDLSMHPSLSTKNVEFLIEELTGWLNKPTLVFCIINFLVLYLVFDERKSKAYMLNESYVYYYKVYVLLLRILRCCNMNNRMRTRTLEELL